VRCFDRNCGQEFEELDFARTGSVATETVKGCFYGRPEGFLLFWSTAVMYKDNCNRQIRTVN
jgi:hypothetical protein